MYKVALLQFSLTLSFGQLEGTFIASLPNVDRV